MASGPQWWAGVTPPASPGVGTVADPAAWRRAPAAVAAESSGACRMRPIPPPPTPPPLAAPPPAARSHRRRVPRRAPGLRPRRVPRPSCLLLIPSFAIAGAVARQLGLSGVPAAGPRQDPRRDQRDPANPCAPQAEATTFASTDTIYVGGYFSRAVLPRPDRDRSTCSSTAPERRKRAAQRPRPAGRLLLRAGRADRPVAGRVPHPARRRRHRASSPRGRFTVK